MEHHKTHHKTKKSLSTSFYKKVIFVLGITLILFALYNTFQIPSLGELIDKKFDEAKESARPAVIELLIITANDCEDCYDISAVVDLIESTGVNITKTKEIDFSSSGAKKVIEKYNIEKVPTVIAVGEISKSKSLSLKLNDIAEEKEGVYIFTKLEPPFIETSTGDVRGRITLLHVKKEDCAECTDYIILTTQLSRAGVVFKEQKEVDIESDEGKNLVNKYAIEKVPTIIMDKEIKAYPTIIQDLGRLGSIEDDGAYVMREINPPYYSIEENAVKGIVTMISLTDKTCENCYDPDKFHKPIIQRMGVLLSEEKAYDVSDKDGKNLIKQYDITKIPTIILEGDVEEYPVLIRAWEPVGTVESDGAYVFRKLEVTRQTYKDLSTNEIVEPQATG